MEFNRLETKSQIKEEGKKEEKEEKMKHLIYHKITEVNYNKYKRLWMCNFMNKMKRKRTHNVKLIVEMRLVRNP